MSEKLTDEQLLEWSSADWAMPDSVKRCIVSELLALRAERAKLEAAACDVLAERERQKAVEGWTHEHDDSHDKGEMALAAASYAEHSARFRDATDLGGVYSLKAHPSNWPWSRQWWKPKDRRRDLVRAGALILAEIERLDRAQPAESGAMEDSAERWPIGTFVMKAKGAQWRGHIVGYYSTALTPIGYCVESIMEPGSVQIYSQAALRLAQPAESGAAE